MYLNILMCSLSLIIIKIYARYICWIIRRQTLVNPTNADVYRQMIPEVGPPLAASRCRPGTEVGRQRRPVPMYVVDRRWADRKLILGLYFASLMMPINGQIE